MLVVLVELFVLADGLTSFVLDTGPGGVGGGEGGEPRGEEHRGLHGVDVGVAGGGDEGLEQVTAVGCGVGHIPRGDCGWIQGEAVVVDAHLRQVAKPALRHRLRRDPLDDADATVRVDRVLTEVFGG